MRSIYPVCISNAYNYGPSNSFGIQSKTLRECHSMFLVRCGFGAKGRRCYRINSAVILDGSRSVRSNSLPLSVVHCYDTAHGRSWKVGRSARKVSADSDSRYRRKRSKDFGKRTHSRLRRGIWVSESKQRPTNSGRSGDFTVVSPQCKYRLLSSTVPLNRYLKDDAEACIMVRRS